MTEKEKKLVEATHDMSCGEIHEIFQKFCKSGNEGFKQKLTRCFLNQQ